MHERGDIIQNIEYPTQYMCTLRNRVLGCAEGYAIKAFDGPLYTYGEKIAIIGDCCSTEWQHAEPSITGTMSITHNTNQINGTSTTFTTDFQNGDKIIVGLYQHIIDTVNNDTTLTLTEPYLGDTLNNEHIFKLV